MKIALVLNGDAGTLRGLAPQEVGEEIAEIFRAAGHEVDLTISAGGDAVAAVRRICGARSAEAVVVGGGDGTVSAAAAAAAESGLVLGILPLGTMNFFARSLQIPQEMKEAAHALAEGEVVPVDIGRINDRTFVHAVSLGIHPEMVEEREKLSYGSRYGKMLGSVRAWLRVLRSSRRFGVVLDVEGERVAHRTVGLVITNNRLGEGHLPYADRLDTGVLALYVTTAQGPLQLMRVTASAALGALETSPLIDVYETASAEVELPRRRSVRVTVDGELVRMTGTLRLSCVSGGLRAMRPRISAA